MHSFPNIDSDHQGLAIWFSDLHSNEDGVSILRPTKNPTGGELTEEQKAFNRILSAVQAIVEHPFRLVKQQFEFTKVRYREPKKNTEQIVRPFALDDLGLGLGQGLGLCHLLGGVRL